MSVDWIADFKFARAVSDSVTEYVGSQAISMFLNDRMPVADNLLVTTDSDRLLISLSRVFFWGDNETEWLEVQQRCYGLAKLLEQIHLLFDSPQIVAGVDEFVGSTFAAGSPPTRLRFDPNHWLVISPRALLEESWLATAVSKCGPECRVKVLANGSLTVMTMENGMMYGMPCPQSNLAEWMPVGAFAQLDQATREPPVG